MKSRLFLPSQTTGGLALVDRWVGRLGTHDSPDLSRITKSLPIPRRCPALGSLSLTWWCQRQCNGQRIDASNQLHPDYRVLYCFLGNAQLSLRLHPR